MTDEPEREVPTFEGNVIGSQYEDGTPLYVYMLKDESLRPTFIWDGDPQHDVEVLLDVSVYGGMAFVSYTFNHEKLALCSLPTFKALCDEWANDNLPRSH